MAALADKNHAKSVGVWLVLAKKGTTQPTTLVYDAALEEAICFGWIDGQLEPARQRDFPEAVHTSKCPEPLVTKERRYRRAVACLGRMHPSGEDEVQKAKADGRWQTAYAGQASIEVPDDLQAALIANPRGPGNVRDADEREPLRHFVSDRQRKEGRDSSQAHFDSSWRCWPGARPSTRKARNHLGDDSLLVDLRHGRRRNRARQSTGASLFEMAGHDVGGAGCRPVLPGCAGRRADFESCAGGPPPQAALGGGRWRCSPLLCLSLAGCAGGCGSHRAAGRCPGW